MNIALIGHGFMGKAHSNAYAQVGRFFDLRVKPRMKVICGQDRARLSEVAARWGWEETSGDWQEVVRRDDVDAVDIAAPNYLHAEMAIAAARAGKIVLCEKPMATSLEDAGRMADAAKHLRTLVWFNYRRVPAIALAKQMVEDGRIGRVFHYRATYLQQWGPDPGRKTGWKVERRFAGSGVTGDLLSHVADTATFLNGPIAAVCAMQTTFEPDRDIDDASAVLVRFANGSTGTFEATRYATGSINRQRFEMNGSRGALEFNLEDLNRLTFFDAMAPKAEQGARSILVTGPDQPYAANFWKPGHIIGYEHTFIATLGDFLQAIEGDRPFHPDFHDGLAVQRVLEAIERSARGGAWMEVADN